MGWPPNLTPQQQKEAPRRRAQGETFKELAKSYNEYVASDHVSESTPNAIHATFRMGVFMWRGIT
jgi:hypothetical protein